VSVSVLLPVEGVRVLGLRADGRPVVWIRGGAEGDGGTGGAGEGAAGGAGASGVGAAGSGAGSGAAAGGAAGSGEGAGGGSEDELEFSEDNFNKLIERHNAIEAEREAEREEWRKKLHNASQDASKARQRARTLVALIGEESSGKPGPKATAAKAADASANEAEARLAELSKQLDEQRIASLRTEARARLIDAGVPKAAAAKTVNLLSLAGLEMDPSGDVAGLDDQITELKESMPMLFAPATAAAAANGAGNGTGTGARILRAAPAVAGRGAAGRGGGEAAKEPTASQKLADRLNGKAED